MSLAGLHKSLSNSFVFGGDTLGRLLGAYIEKTNKVARKVVLQKTAPLQEQ